MRIGVFCSGGDAPGMNACLRAVVRAGRALGHEIVGIYNGYQGLLDELFYQAADGKFLMGPRCVSHIIQTGGTILRTSRCPAFLTKEGQSQAADVLRRHHIDALIPIGGDGTFHGAVALAEYWDGKIVGCPGTIDNDLLGSDYTIGFHTALNTAVEAVDKLRDTAESHERMFVVEVMGRHSGCIAVSTSLASGGEIVCIPETPTDVAALIDQAHLLKERGKRSVIIVVAEGDEMGGANALIKQLDAAGCPYPMRSVILGYLQRGGSPVPADRILGSVLGSAAVQAVQAGRTGVMAGEVGGQVQFTPFAETYVSHKPIPAGLLPLLNMLAQ